MVWISYLARETPCPSTGIWSLSSSILLHPPQQSHPVCIQQNVFPKAQDALSRSIPYGTSVGQLWVGVCTPRLVIFMCLYQYETNIHTLILLGAFWSHAGKLWTQPTTCAHITLRTDNNYQRQCSPNTCKRNTFLKFVHLQGLVLLPRMVLFKLWSTFHFFSLLLPFPDMHWSMTRDPLQHMTWGS